jgi:hypothetical protein
LRGLLADVNVQGHLGYIRQVLVALDLWNFLNELGLEFASSAKQELARDWMNFDE